LVALDPVSGLWEAATDTADLMLWLAFVVVDLDSERGVGGLVEDLHYIDTSF
jgi:hypothetical protein